jgi:hypothetical protein
MKKILALILIATVVPSCASPPYKGTKMWQLKEYAESHPELPPAISRAIMNGEVVPGMNRQQVEVVLGRPDLTNVSKKTKQERWVYYQNPVTDWLLGIFVRVKRKVVVFDEGGTVISYTEGDSPAVLYRLSEGTKKLFRLD